MASGAEPLRMASYLSRKDVSLHLLALLQAVPVNVLHRSDARTALILAGQFPVPSCAPPVYDRLGAKVQVVTDIPLQMRSFMTML